MISIGKNRKIYILFIVIVAVTTGGVVGVARIIKSNHPVVVTKNSNESTELEKAIQKSRDKASRNEDSTIILGATPQW